MSDRDEERVGGKRAPPPNVDGMYTLKVDNIAFRSSKESLTEEFSKFGEVGDVYIPRVHGTVEPKGFAFVRFLDKRDAEDAQRNLDGKELDGRIIRIQEAKEKRPDNPKDFYTRSRRYNDRDDRGYHRDRDYDRDGRDRFGGGSGYGRDRGGGGYDDRDRDRDRDRGYGRDYDRDRDRERGRDRGDRHHRSGGGRDSRSRSRDREWEDRRGSRN